MAIIWTAADKWCQTIQTINGRSKVVVMKVSSRLQPVNDIKPYRTQNYMISRIVLNFELALCHIIMAAELILSLFFFFLRQLYFGGIMWDLSDIFTCSPEFLFVHL